MKKNESDKIHKERLLEGLKVPNKVTSKILCEEKQLQFERMCRGELQKDLERINQNYENIFGL